MMQHSPQAGILLPVPPQARFLFLSLLPGAHPGTCLRTLRDQVDGEKTVIGLGRVLVTALSEEIEGLRDFPALAGPGVAIPATPTALWIWLRGKDRGEIYHRSRRLLATLAPAFHLDDTRDAFMFDSGRDLTGYEDGTENPVDQKAVDTAIVATQDSQLGGSSFVAVQRWRHDFSRFDRMSEEERDLGVGRRRVSNEEIDDAPESAHVKRTAQESFSPEAFVVRRSMPWVEGMHGGLMFIAFGRSLDAFEEQLRHMLGLDDGIVDATFKFTRPESGAYFWCPAMVNGRLDLSPLGL